jgi:signal transduction histidine kinase
MRVSLSALSRGLPFRLLLLTIVFVMLAEVLIFVPSVARFRQGWLEAKLASGHLAAYAIEAAPEGMVTDDLKRRLLSQVGALAIDVSTAGNRIYMIGNFRTAMPEGVIDLDRSGPAALVADAFDLLFDPRSRVVEIRGTSPKDRMIAVRMVIEEWPLRDDMLDFAWRIVALSIVISLITAGLVFLSLLALMVRPVRRMVDAIMAFRRDPENPAAIVAATTRGDELGLAQRELAEMQIALRTALRQRERLATLGTAVAKIHHDLGGILSTAAIVSERIVASEDPEIRRVAPRLMGSIDRALDLTAQILSYARDGVMPLARERVALRPVADEVAEEVGGSGYGDGRAAPVVTVAIPQGLTVDGDRELLRRCLANLVRNAVQSGARRVTLDAGALGGEVRLTVADDGTGLPPRARENLFQPFAGTARPGGVGLGLAIVREVMRAHGGEIVLERTGPDGTTFLLRFPVAAAS